ncbi:MAG: SAM-dependent methyltransferase [Candidatus Xenobia bacterium]
MAVAVVQGVCWDYSTSLVETALFGRHLWWWQMHALSLREYGWLGPSRLARQKARQEHLNEVQMTYGEVCGASFVHMLRSLDVAPGTRLVDLGCGRGLYLLTAAKLFGIQVEGCDVVEGFVQRGQRLAAALGLQQQVRFVHQDALACDLSGADIVHVVSTTFVPTFRRQLLPRLLELPAGTRVITHAWALPQEHFRLIGSREYPATWGWSSVGFYQRM